jgi:hypothetical protein
MSFDKANATYPVGTEEIKADWYEDEIAKR